MQLINIQEVKTNPNNPRIIKDYKYKKLLNSIKESPTFMQINTLKLDEDFMLLAGNMRHRVCKELGWKEVPVNIFTRDMAEKNNKERLAMGLKEASYEDQCKEFMIKDNVSFGEWEWDVLGNEWNVDELDHWNLSLPTFNENISYEPVLTPSFDGKQLTEEQYEKKKDELENKNLQSGKDFISCLCPNCYHEFNVEKK